MYGNSGKLGGRGRGNGGGGGTGGGGGRGSAVKRNRSPFPQPSSLLPHRTVVGPSSNRLSTTGGGAASSRNRNEISNPSSINTPDETFNLVSDDPLSYAMIIRLTPDLVDEIRRVESQGGNAQIKFDSNANNSSGNVIDVGGKDFRFTWSHEPGDLCDIYEERRSGEDGKGLLVESGCPWRKLNVQRILDESTKNHVKMRSEEAEQKSKSRKAIILDHANPSIKNQLKTAVDFNQRRTPFSSKREPAFKKQKVESTQVFAGGPPKSIFKPGFSSTPSTKGRLPVPSPPEQTITSTSPFGSGNHRMVPAGVDYPQAPNKDNTANSGKETPSRTVHAFGYDLSGSKMGSGATSKDLQRMLITLLQEHPKGMSLEALERSVGDTIPNCAKKIDPILNKIATSQVPGWYYLKPGVELESFKKPSSGSESSPELGHEQTPRQGSNLVEKAATGEFQPLVQSKLEESSPNENIDILQNSPDILGDKKALDNSEGHASSSSSGSDSDSESDSSDSESDSGSPRSPSAARSGSSSDSESEGSSSNEEGSDVDVDIMIGDDEKEPENKLQTTTSSSVPWKTIDDDPTQNGIDKPEHLVSDTAKVAEDSPDDDIEIDIVDDFDAVPYVANMRSFPDDLNKPRDSEQVPSVSNIGNGNQITKDHGSEMPNSPNKMSKPKPKRSSELNYDDEKSEDAKRLKAGILSQQPTFVRGKDAFPSEDPLHLSHDKLNQDPKKVHNVNMSSKDSKDECADTTLPKGYNLAMAGKSISDVQQSVQRSGDVGTRRKTFNTERPIKYVDNFARGVELYERSPSLPDRSDGSALRSINAQEKVSKSRGRHKETNDEDGGSFQQSVGKIQNERDIRDKQFMLSDSHSHFRRHGEQVGKLKDVTNSQTGSFSEKDNDNTTPGKSPVGNRKGKMLRREVSELELGELREPISAVDPQAVKKKFDRSNSVKKSKSKSSASDNSDSVMRVSKGRTSAEKIEEPRKHSPPNSRVGSDINQQNLLQKRTPIDDNEDSWTRPQRVGLSQAQQMPLVDSADFEARSQLNKSADMGSKSKKNGYGDTPKKAPISLPQQHDTRHAEQNISQITVREPIPQNTIAITSSNGRVKESLLENSNNSRTRRESSSEEDDASYYKYEKDEPEFKGIINDYPQYKEYVQEYCDKYEVYLSIDKQLEVYRTRFGKLGRDLELAKGRDMQRYNTLVEELKEAYRQCGTRNDWLKKIFVVLHQELKNLKQRIKDFAYEYAKD